MALDERSRHALYLRLAEVLGAEEAATLMEHLPPTGWAEVSTKRDLDHLEAVTRGDIERFQAVTRGYIERFQASTRADIERFQASTRADIERFRVSTRADFERLETTVRGDIEQLASATRAELQAVRADLLATMLQQNRAMFFAMAGLMVTLAALAFGAARLG